MSKLMEFETVEGVTSQKIFDSWIHGIPVQGATVAGKPVTLYVRDLPMGHGAVHIAILSTTPTGPAMEVWFDDQATRVLIPSELFKT